VEVRPCQVGPPEERLLEVSTAEIVPAESRPPEVEAPQIHARQVEPDRGTVLGAPPENFQEYLDLGGLDGAGGSGVVASSQASTPSHKVSRRACGFQSSTRPASGPSRYWKRTFLYRYCGGLICTISTGQAGARLPVACVEWRAWLILPAVTPLYGICQAIVS
jgi:hypothetical protein